MRAYGKLSEKLISLNLIIDGSVLRRSVKKVFLKIMQNSQESTSARVPFFYKVAGLLHGTPLVAASELIDDVDFQFC